MALEDLRQQVSRARPDQPAPAAWLACLDLALRVIESPNDQAHEHRDRQTCLTVAALQERVNAILPGSIQGPRIDGVIERDAAARGMTPAQIRKVYERQVSLRSFVEADDVANTALFLASREGRMISGQILGVDGHTESLSNWLDD